MKETTFVVTVNADGKYNTKMYSEEDYNSKVVPFLSEHYTPDQYSVAGLQDTTADNITEDGQYIVSVDANGATHRKTYTGKELLGGKLTTIGQQFPDYRLQYVDGAVRPAEGSDDIIAVPWQKQMGAKIAQQKDNIGKTLKEVDETVADVKGANLSELLKERGDAMTNFANMAVYNGLTKTPEELEAMHQEDLYRRDLRDINKELEDVNNQLDEWVQHEIDIEDFGGPNLQWILDNAARKDELLTRKADLIQRQTSNPYYKREDKRLNEIADNVIAKAYPALADLSVEGDIITPNNPEADVWQAARYFADKAKTTLSAPDDNANGFVSFLKGHGARFSDADFWLAGLESIASNMKVKKVFDTISSKLASYADQNIEKELTDGDLDYLLSDAEKQLLLSFVTASEAEALRAQNTNNMYNAGVTSAESLAFMAQFILTGGVGDAFAAGSKRAARGLATWLAKNTGKIGTRAASMASKAGVTLVGRGATAAADAVVTPFLKSIPMTLMQTGLYKDYAQKLTERDEAGNLKYDYDTAVLPALRDAGLEVWSEMALEPVLSVFGKTMGIGIDKLAGKSKVAAMFNTKLDDLATFFHNREAMEILAKAGFDGYFEEIGEEILAAGVSSLWEPEAWSQFWEKDNLVTMAVAFAPMSIIGGGMSMANYVKREMAYDEIAPSVQEMLARRGVLTDEQISELFNRDVNTMQDVADKISGIINPIIASGQITAEEFKTLYDFAAATAQKDIANALVKRAEEDRRIVMRNNMDQRMNGKQYIGKDAEGNETISFYEDEKGNRRYVVVDAGNTDGLCLSMDENGKDLKIVNVNELEVTTMGANAFFDNMWKEGQAAQESQRMQDDAARQRQSVAQALKSGKPVQMYNPQTNEREDYVFLGWNGEAAVMANAKTGVEEERTIQDLANALHISDTVLTDAQREQAQIDESRKNDSIARSANDYKGAPVNFNGVSGTLLRLSSRGDENGNSSLVASIITSNGELVPVNVTADMVEDFIQERKDLAASGNAAAADRRTRDHERKEQQRKDSEAYRSSKEKYTNPDGSVREGEFLDNDPRGFAMYSDGKYGKADTDATLAAALANAQTKAQQALQAKEAEANPDVKAGLRDQYQRAVAALDTLDTLLNERHQDESSNGELAPDAAREKYQEYENLGLSDDEIYELGMKSINEIRERIAALPVPAVSTDVQSYMDQKKKYSEAVAAEQKKIDYWRSILSAPMTESEKKDVARANARMQRRVADIMAEKAATKDAGAIARLDKELKDVAEGFIGQAIADINTEGDPVVISTAATIEKDMRDAGSTERAITNVLSAIQEGYQPRGIFDPTSGVIFFIADYNTDVAEARNTFIHERQHKRTREAGLAEILIDRLGLTGRTEEEKKAVLLPELAKLIRTSFYDGKSARDIADEIISYSVEHEFNGVLDSLGLNDIITNFAKNIDNERSNAAGLSEPGRNGNVNESYRVADQRDERAQEAESGAVAGQGSGSLEGSEAEEVIDGLTASQRAEINKNVGGEIEAGEGSAPVMFSVTAQVTGVGFDYHIGDDGSVSFVGPDGRVFDSEHHITVKDLQAVDRSAFKYLDDFCHTMGYYDDKASTRIWQKYADMLNAYLDKGAGEGGFGNLTKEWQWIADSVKKVFRAVATNSDAQYSKSLDITRVCKKNEAVINAISALQRKLGYGITPGQIMDIYYNTLEAGYQAPCPVCYVFTRYIRNGQYATIMLNGKQKYGDRLQDVSMLSVADRKKAVKFWLKEYDSQLALNEKHDKTVAAAKQDITVILDEIDKLSEEYGKADTSDERKAEIRTRIDELDAQYKSALNVVSQSSLDSWITQFAIHKVSKKNANKPGVIARKGANGKMEYWDLWEDQRPFPDEIALDLRETATAMTEFAAIQRFRNSRGAAAGKEITFAADNGVGEVALMLANEKDPRNYLQEAVDAKDEKTRRALLKTAYDKLASAHIYAQQQTLRGGQRMWSWSDNIERLAPDVFINILQLEMLGGGMQTYSKQLEGIKSVATMDAYVNGSLMGRGIGYMEVPEDMVGVKDGKYILTKPITHTNERKGEETVDAQAGDVLYEFDGKLYALVFDDVVGVQAFAKPDIEDNGKVKKGLFDLNAELDKAGNIIVGMDDLHVRMAMADDRIFFIIPWHSSGANNHILSQMYRYLGAGEVKGTDFTNVQEEKYMGESKKEDNATEAESVEVDEAKESETSGKMTPALVEFWENHRNEEDFACGLGHIDSGDGKGNLSQGQIEYKALRDVILKGYEFRTGQFDKKTGKEKTKLIPVRDAAAMGIEEAKNMYAKIQADAFLSQAEQTVYDSVDTHLMTSGDTKFIYPYEYWDKDSTMATADVNGARYLEYCRRMGYKPKFCGTLNPNAKKDYGNFADDKGYWKLLIDRRMYDRDGNYQDLVKVNTSRFSPSLVDPSKTKDEFIVTRVADEEGNESIAEKTYELEQKRPGGVAAVDYSLTLDKAVDLYETAKSDPEKYYKRINGTAASLAFRVGNNSAEDQAEIQKALDLVNGVKTFQEEDGDVRFSIRTKPAPKNTGIGYKVFYLKDGKLYPPMVANPDGADTPVGVWLDADAAPQAATSKTGRKKVKAGGKGTQGGSGTLAYRPGWHLGEIPYALQFNRGPKVDNPLGITGKNGKVIKVGKYFPANFVWAEVEYAKDVDYQDEAMSYGYNEAGNFQHSLAGLPKVPEDGSYTYRTNANPATDPWIITGAMKVNRVLTDSEVDELVRQAGREPQLREGKTEEPRDVRENNEPSFRVVNNNQQVFVSNALASLDKIPMKSGNAQAWINKIQQAGGLKKEEDKWMGLTDWLKEQKGNISKEDVAAFIREHQIQIEEVKYGTTPINTDYMGAIAKEKGVEFRDRFLDAFNVYLEEGDEDKGAPDRFRAELVDDEEAMNLYNENHEDKVSLDEDGYLDYLAQDKVMTWGDEILDAVTGAGEKPINLTRMGYTTDGLENNREIALVIPTIEPYNERDYIHFGDAGEGRAIAWARFGEAVDENGNRVLVIDEIQSKRHQKGKEKGYDSVPDAPFRDSWDALAMKRMLRLAAEEGYDKIAWTNGSMQAERYNIGHAVDHIRYDGMIGAGENQGAKIFTLKYKDKGTDYVSGDYDQAIVNESGDIVMGQFQGNKLSDLVGKDIATEMLGMNERGSRLEGESLRIGGEGMRYFYDQKLVNWMNKYSKKWGVQVADLTLPDLENKDGWHSVDVTPEMRESVMEGQPMFRTADEREKLFKDAKDEFGTTRDFREAGYLLPDGSMLDFSEKKNGGEPGRRGADHRDIARVINDRSYGTMTEYLDDFINEGAIRLIPESGAFSVAQQPTKEQKNMLRNFIYRYNGEVEVEIYKNGHSVADPYYRERTSPTRILNDIDAYFKDGTIPEGNAPMFRMVEITPETRQEMEQIEAIARVNGTYLKAPNGADTKLNPEQWSMVRTKAFKNWFGDWENDPANASKVLDENGEPMVVYHATTSEFTAFEMGHKKKPLQSYMQDTSLKIGHWFSPKREWAEGFAKRAEENFGGKGVIMEVFLNIRNPKTYTKDTRLTRDASERDDLVAKANAIRDKWKGSKLKAFNALDKCILDPDIMVDTIINNADALGIKLRNLNDSKMEELEKDLLDYGRIVWEYKIRRGYDFSILDNEEPYDQLKYDIKKGYEQFITNTKSDGFDGVLVKQTAYDPYVGKYNDQYVAFDPNQIKSATDNTGSFDPTDPDIRYRVVPGGESMAERTYRESGAFSFTGSEKISSIDDVAFIFRELQERATENSFLVLVKDGVPTILHTGIGNVSSTAIDMTAAVAGYNDFKPDVVYMVHNHPSGNLYASRADRTILDQLRGIFNGVPVEGIILDTVSGNYGVFDQWSDTEREMPESGDEFPVKVLAFDKQVFDKEFRSQMNDRKVRGAEDVAAFLSAHRLGDGDKLGVLLLNHNNIIVANYVTNDNALTGRNAEKIARQVADVAVHNGATATIMFGNFNFTDTALTKFNSAIKIAAAGEISLLDVVQMDNYGNYHSVADGTLNGRRDGVMFRVTPEVDEAYKDAVDAGDMKMAQSLVDAAAESAMADSQVRDENGKLLHMYHGTRAAEKFYVFDTFNERSDNDLSNVGSHFGPKGTAQEFSKDNLYDVYLNLKKVWEAPFDFFADIWNNAYLEALIDLRNQCEKAEAKLIFDRIYDVYPILATYDLNEISIVDEFYNDEGLEDSAETDSNTGAFKITKAWSDHRNAMVQIMRDMMEAEGFDGISYENWYEGEQDNLCYVALYPSQIKSADAVTYDNQGNMIPLSQRFTDNDDIRFRISGENATFAEEDANELANDIANEVYRQISSQENSGNLATEVDSESDGEVLFRFIGELGADRLDKTDGGRRILDLIEAKKYYTPDSAENIKRAYGWELDKDAKGNPVWKYEENDFGIKDLNIKDGAKLSDVIDDEGLFAAYPELKNYTLAIEDLKDSSGYLNETNKKIALEKGAEKEDDRLILIHEIQHFIQDKEGWVRGANIKSQLILDTVKDIFPYIRKDLNMFLKSAVKRIFNKSYKKESIRNFRFFTDKWGFNPIEYLFQLKKANYLAYVAYLRKAGEVEARNAEKRADMTALERRRSLAPETEDRPRSRQWRKTPYEDVMFRIGPAAEMKKKGMVEYLTPEQLTEFTDRALQSGFTADELSTINDRAFEMGGDYSVPVLEHFARLAEKDNLDAHDNEIVEKARQSLVSIIGAKDETFDQNDMLWVAYDAVHGDEEGIYNQIHNRKVKRALDEASSVEPDLTLADYLKKAAEAKDDLIAQYTALRELANNLTRIMDAMSARRDYDRVTVGKLVSLTDDILTSKLMDDVTNGEIKRLTSIIRRANCMRDIQSRVNELYNLILTNNLRRLKGLFEKELKKKAVKIDSNNVVNQGALDLNGQIAMTAMKENLDSFSEDQSGNIVISQTLADKIADARDRTQSEDAKESERADMELLGLTFARDYIDGVVASEKEEQQLRDALKEADEALRKDEMNHLEHLQFVKEQTRALAECRTERVGKFTTLLQKMQDLSAASHELALMMNEKDKERIAQIHHDANSDMQGVPSDEHPKDATFLQRLSNNPFTQFFFRPLATFDQMLRLFGNKSVNGEGYLWNRFMRGWIDATGKEYKALQAAYEILDDKVSKVFGKKMRWSDLYSVEAKMPKATISFWDGGIMKEHELTQGNLLYIMLADQMTDGRMKLRAMGITEEDVDAIRSQMDARFKDLADWIVNDFLPSRREAYNEVHERMFGASMSKVQNYFPLKVLSNARTQQVDVASASTDPSTPSTVTGSIMKRTRNALALDVMGTDAFSLVIEHVQKMEHWAAFAEWNRDLSDLLSYKRFRNQVQNMTSIYGSQRNLWTEFVDTAMIAAGSYKGKSGKLDPAFNRIAKGVTAAKISLRVFTAIKQFLSFPAYFSEANPVYLAAGFVKGWNWSMDNLPLFEKRWKSRQAGDHILAEGNLGKINEYLARIGMTPNALVDAFTVSIGSYAMYKTKYDKYIKMGFSPEAADKRAKQDAVILYNETQQSSEAAFMSSMQSGRSTLEKMFTVFRNSSMGYQRQVHDALRNYKHRLTPGYKKDSIEYMTKQLIREGLTEGQAMKAAKGLFARQGVKDMTRLMIFGYGLQFFWSLAPYLPYLLFGDDDDKKKEMLVDAAEKGVFGSLEGLTGGNLMSEAGNLLVFGEGLNNWDPSLLPLISDFTNLYQEFGKDNVRAMNDLLNLGIQIGIGVNPQTLEDAVVAIIDACNGDLGTAKEAMLLGLRIINAPQTSLDQLYLDEIDMNALEAKDLTIPELAERYAKYKKAKGAGAMAPLYSLDPALDDDITAKYLESFENKAKERLDGIESDGMYADIAEQAKAMDKRIEDLRKLAKSGDEDAEKELMEIFLSDDFRPLIMFNEVSKDVKTAINNAVSAPTREEMLMYLDEAERLRSNILKGFGDRESNESWFRAKYTQYTKGFLPEMARLEKKYSEEYAKANPKYKEWMEKHQQDLDNAADKAKSNAERVAEIDAELKKYEIELPNGKKRYFNQPARKKLQEEKKALREEGTTEKAYLNRLKKQEGFTPEDFMPPAIYNSPEFQTYLEFKSLGSVSENNFRFKTISEWETKMNEAEDPETRAKYREKIDERMILLGQQITRKLNGVDDEDDGFSLDLEEDLD